MSKEALTSNLKTIGEELEIPSLEDWYARMHEMDRSIVRTLCTEIAKLRGELLEAKRQRNDEQRLRLAAERNVHATPVTVTHAPTCPVSQHDFRVVEGLVQCNCDFMGRLRAALSGDSCAPENTPLGPPWEFDRYVNGQLKAEGIKINRALTFEQALERGRELLAKMPCWCPYCHQPHGVNQTPMTDAALARSWEETSDPNAICKCGHRADLHTDDWVSHCLADECKCEKFSVETSRQLTEETPREPTASEAASFDKTLARSPRRVGPAKVFADAENNGRDACVLAPPEKASGDGWKCVTCGHENPKGALRCQNLNCAALTGEHVHQWHPDGYCMTCPMRQTPL